MVTKKSASENFPIFFDLELTADQKRALKLDERFKQEWAGAFDLMGQDKLKVVLKWDERNGVALAMVQEALYDPSKPACVFCMRGSSISSAALKLAYYYAVVSDRTLPDTRSRKKIEEDDVW
jgi:hypothetical protein